MPKQSWSEETNYPLSFIFVAPALITILPAFSSENLFQKELDEINTGSVAEVHNVLHRPYQPSITESMLSKVKNDFGKIELAGGFFDRPPRVINAQSIPNGFVPTSAFGLCDKYNNKFSHTIEGESGQEGLVVFSVIDSQSKKVFGIQILRKE